MGATKQKSTIDTHKKRKSNSNATIKLVIKSQGKKTKKEEKKRQLQKQIQNK